MLAESGGSTGYDIQKLCSSFIAGIDGSNSAEGMDGHFLCFCTLCR